MAVKRRRRVLFVAEAVTTAQIARLATLARGLDPSEFHVRFASARFPEMIFRGTAFERASIESISPEAAERASNLGQRLYTKRALQKYVQDDLRAIDDFKPDCIVGDLRWSLAVSGPARGVPVASLINSYWSPWSPRADDPPLPDHPLVTMLSAELCLKHYRRAMPAAFQRFADPVNELRVERGFAPIGSLRETLCWGDLVLHPDASELSPAPGAPSSHVFLGPVIWSAPASDERWREAMPNDSTPLVYVTLGSSGDPSKLAVVLEGLAGLPVRALAATAGRAKLKRLPANARVFDFVPGDEAARRAALVISNGGSTTGYQALAAGAPVLGIPRNLDQYLASQAICAFGAGLELRSGGLRAGQVEASARLALATPALRERAAAVAETFRHYDALRAFRDAIASF